MRFTGKRLRKSRCFLLLISIFVLCSFWGFTINAKADEPGGGHAADLSVPRELQAVSVESGDTLWNLIEEYYDYQGDIRNRIYEVKEINGMKESRIYPGQIIYIPVN